MQRWQTVTEPCLELAGEVGERVPRHSRGDLGLEEDEDEDQHSRDTAGAHHPHGEILLQPHGVDEPASDRRVGHLHTFRHHQFLQDTVG